MGLLRDNPVLVRELRIRMRGAKAYWLVLSYVVVAAILVGCVAVWFAERQRHYYGSPPTAEDLGQALFFVLMIGQAAMVCLAAPGISSATISSERERLTYGLLRATLLKALHIVAGKLVASLSYLALLVLSGAPFVAIVFLYGGVSILQIVVAYFTLTAAGLYFGAAGLWWSAVCRRTATSSVGAYGTMLLFAVGGPLVALLIILITEWQSSGPGDLTQEMVAFFLSLNPAVSVGIALLEGNDFGFGVCQHWPIAAVCYLVLAALTILLTTLRVQHQTE